jgi:hypothetical protein
VTLVGGTDFQLQIPNLADIDWMHQGTERLEIFFNNLNWIGDSSQVELGATLA